MDIRLKIDFDPEPFALKMKHGDRCVLMGSCFSNEMGAHFTTHGFDVLSNPFGTIFHPEPIARIISETISGDVHGERIFQRKDLFFSWDAGGTIFGKSAEALQDELTFQRASLLEYLKTSRYLFVTFGSVFGYTEKDLEKVVANCHKMPSGSFDKSLTDIYLLTETWMNALSSLQVLNPLLHVVFTVSPVRHAKDGLVANNRSKARLFELITALEEKHAAASYFPSYEIVMDELRDYRFYKEDGLHPNEQATKYVWEKLKQSLFGAETQLLCEQIASLRRREAHRSLYPESLENEHFVSDTRQKIREFLRLHPEVKWK